MLNSSERSNSVSRLLRNALRLCAENRNSLGIMKFSLPEFGIAGGEFVLATQEYCHTWFASGLRVESDLGEPIEQAVQTPEPQAQ